MHELTSGAIDFGVHAARSGGAPEANRAPGLARRFALRFARGRAPRATPGLALRFALAYPIGSAPRSARGRAGRSIGFAAALAFALGLAACASGGSASGSDAKKDGAHPIRIRYVHYSSGQKLELIDRSLSSSADFYSKTRKLEDASTKVTTDEVLQETVAEFEAKGFFEKAEPGGSPASGENALFQSLEVETPERFVHMSVRKGSSAADLQIFTDCKKAFILIYNDTYQLQSVDRPPDWNAQGKKNPTPAKQ
jgi:hypothetical protein